MSDNRPNLRSVKESSDVIAGPLPKKINTKINLHFWLDVYDKLDDELHSVNEEVNWIHEYIGRPFVEDTKKRLRELDDLYNKYYHMREYTRNRILRYEKRITD